MHKPTTLKAYRWVQEDERLGPDFPQDAVHGVSRSQPDAHIYFQWLTADDGVNFTHYEVLAATEVQGAEGSIMLPKVVNRVRAQDRSESRSNSFFDAATYKGKTFQFGKLTGRLPAGKDYNTMWRPVQPDKIGNIFPEKPSERAEESSNAIEDGKPDATYVSWSYMLRNMFLFKR